MRTIDHEKSLPEDCASAPYAVWAASGKRERLRRARHGLIQELSFSHETPQQQVVQRVARFVALMRDQRVPEKVQVADGIEHLVLNELVVRIAARRCSTRYSSITIGVIEAAPRARPARDELDVLHESEVSAPAHSRIYDVSRSRHRRTARAFQHG